MPIYESKFSDGSFGYRPGRSAKDAVQKIKEYAEQGYTRAVVLDLSKYFDTINHELLVNILRRDVKDERVIQMIRRYLRSGVMENGVVVKTEEGSPQGGNLSPLLANVYLNAVSYTHLLAGGSGSVARAMFGCAIIAVINNGMTLMEISAYWQKVVIGAIIILAVMLDMAQKGKEE